MPAPAAAQQAQQPQQQGAATPAAAAARAAIPALPDCPGLAGGVGGLPCQLVVCGALGTFWRISYNVSLPWNEITGWELTKSLGCGRLVTAAAAARPAYCKWPGITCCTPQAAAAGACRAVHAVTNISMPVNQVNVSISDQQLLGVFDQLHACGLRGLNLEANEISGDLPQGRLGRLTHLAILNLGALAGRGAAAAMRLRRAPRVGGWKTAPCGAPRRARWQGVPGRAHGGAITAAWGRCCISSPPHGAVAVPRRWRTEVAWRRRCPCGCWCTVHDE